VTALVSPRRGRGRPASGRQTPLRREEILDRALEMVRTEGREALSMRALARELGVTPMALYHHIADKRDLLAALIERVWSDIGTQLPGLPSDPVEFVVASSLLIRRVWLDHFDLASLAVAVFDDDEVLYRTTRAHARMFEAAGFPDVPLAYSAVQNFTMGTIEVSANRRAASAYFGRDPASVLLRTRRLLRRHGASRNHRGVLDARFDDGDDRYFEPALRALIAGLLGTPPSPAT
jgi:AcrR family transcriptional regulator